MEFSVDTLLDGDIFTLTASFFMLNFFAATQDIAVDGWALTMLTKPNRNLASTMNSIGQTFGYMLGYLVFLALESAEFCNSYWPFRIGSSSLVLCVHFVEVTTFDRTFDITCS